jgi:hypothetical protein
MAVDYEAVNTTIRQYVREVKAQIPLEITG